METAPRPVATNGHLMQLMRSIRDVLLYHVAIGSEAECARTFEGEGRVRASFMEAVFCDQKCSSFEQALPHPLLHDELTESLFLAIGHDHKMHAATELSQIANTSTQLPTLQSMNGVDRAGWFNLPLATAFEGALILGGLILDLPNPINNTSYAPALLVKDVSNRLAVHVMGVDPRALSDDFITSGPNKAFERSFAYHTDTQRAQLWEAVQQLRASSMEYQSMRFDDTSALLLIEAHATLARLRHHAADAEMRAILAAYSVALRNGANTDIGHAGHVGHATEKNKHVQLLIERMNENLTAPITNWEQLSKRNAYVVFHGIGHAMMQEDTSVYYSTNCENQSNIRHVCTNSRFVLCTAAYYAIYDTIFVVPLNMSEVGHPSITALQPGDREQNEQDFERLNQAMIIHAVQPSAIATMVNNTFDAGLRAFSAMKLLEFDVNIQTFTNRLKSEPWALVTVLNSKALQSVTSKTVETKKVDQTLKRQMSTDSFSDFCEDFFEFCDDDDRSKLQNEYEDTIASAKAAVHEAYIVMNRTKRLKTDTTHHPSIPSSSTDLPRIAMCSPNSTSTLQTFSNSTNPAAPSTELLGSMKHIETLMYACLVMSSSTRRKWERSRKSLAKSVVLQCYKTHIEAQKCAQLAKQSVSVNAQWLECAKGVFDAINVRFNVQFNPSCAYSEGYHTMMSQFANITNQANENAKRMMQPSNYETIQDTQEKRQKLINMLAK